MCCVAHQKYETIRKNVTSQIHCAWWTRVHWLLIQSNGSKRNRNCWNCCPWCVIAFWCCWKVIFKHELRVQVDSERNADSFSIYFTWEAVHLLRNSNLFINFSVKINRFRMKNGLNFKKKKAQNKLKPPSALFNPKRISYGVLCRRPVFVSHHGCALWAYLLPSDNIL